MLLHVLGGFRLQVAADSIAALRGGSRRLLAFLALRDGPIRRTAAAGALWPDVPETHAFASLRSALARLEDAAREAIRVSPDDLGLADDVRVDLGDARTVTNRLLDPRAPLGAEDLNGTTVSVLSADLLPDWYDDWVILEAENWRQQRLHALEALSGRLSAVDHFAGAVMAALAAVRAEPLRESARAALIRAHLAEGNQSEAIAEYERYEALLRAELGLEPTPRLGALLDALQRV